MSQDLFKWDEESKDSSLDVVTKTSKRKTLHYGLLREIRVDRSRRCKITTQK